MPSHKMIFRDGKLGGLPARMMFFLGIVGCSLYAVVRIEAVSTGCPTIDVTDEDAVIQSINMQITCGGDNITVRINTCALEELGHNVTEDVSIAGIDNDPTEDGKICSLETKEDGNNHFYLTLRNYSDCRTEAYSTDSHAWYYNAVRTVHFSNTMNMTIRRSRSIYLPWACSYETSYNVTLGGYQTHEGDVVTIVTSNQVGMNALSAQLCCDQFCSNGSLQPHDEVGTGDVLYLVGQSASIRPIEIIEFYASRDPEADDSERYSLAEDGCPVHSTTTVVSMEPFNVFVKFVMFNWTPDYESNVYFNALVELCNPEEGACYQPECEEPARYKRDRKSSRISHQSITFGPFRYKPSNGPSSQKAGTTTP